MGQTHVEFRKRAQLNEYRVDRDEQEDIAFVGGFSQDCPMPEERFVFRFEPVPNVLQAEPFAAEGISVLTARLFMIFGAHGLGT